MHKSSKKTGKKTKKRQYSHLLDAAVKTQGFESYEKYLESAHWADFKQECKDAGLADRCIACHYPTVVMHHISYKRLGCEELWDVIPVCNRCHNDLHNKGKALGIPLHNPHLTFKSIWGWEDREVEYIFRYYFPHWSRDKQQALKEAREKLLGAEKKKQVATPQKKKSKNANLQKQKKKKVDKIPTRHRVVIGKDWTPEEKKYHNEAKSRGDNSPIAKLSCGFAILQGMIQKKKHIEEIAYFFDVEQQDVTDYTEKYKQYFT